MSITIDPTNHELRQGLQEALRIILAEKTVSALREDHARSCDKQVGWSMDCSCGFDGRVERLRQLADGATVHMPTGDDKTPPSTLQEFQLACELASKILNEYLPEIPGRRSAVNCMGGECQQGHFAGKWLASVWFNFDMTTDQGGEILYGFQQQFCIAPVFEPGQVTPRRVTDVLVGEFLRNFSEWQAGPSRMDFSGRPTRGRLSMHNACWVRRSWNQWRDARGR